ncbi:MAG: tellurite resistance TerB family protein [Hyphomicrobiales bacterium]|nr:tellurite resistance TerB family protein [Hyphomicrobiales bacterium]
MNTTVNTHQALIYVMVTMTAVDARIGDAELQRIGRLVQTLPVFEGFDPERLTHIAQECGEILQVDEGLNAVLGLVSQALPEYLRATAYALAVEVAISDQRIWKEEVRFLARLRDTLDLDKLTIAAIERAASARYQKA